MLREIILLAGAQEAAHLTTFFHKHNPDLTVTPASSRDELTVALYPRRPGVRLVGFCTPIIVPPDALSGLDCRAYNIHPGPPTYPGRHPASFAIYEQAARFGATAHEMLARVDAGPIVGVEWFDMPAEPRLSQVEKLTFDACVRLLRRLGAALATSAEPLPVIGESWSGWKSTQRDFDKLCDLPLDITAAEFERRERAFADGLQGTPLGTFRLTLHGRRFRLDS
jgi:methionyl-tRNA formyltransferase